MSEFITATPETFDSFDEQLSKLWQDKETVLVDTFARVAMYETFRWDREAAGFNPQQLVLSAYSANPRSSLHITSMWRNPEQEKMSSLYPVDTSYNDFFGALRCRPLLSVRAGNRCLDQDLPGEVRASRERTLGSNLVRTLTVGVHLELERLVLATGDYSESVEERARDVAEFSAFADYIKSTGKYPEEFPDSELLLAFPAVSREVYLARMQQALLSTGGNALS